MKSYIPYRDIRKRAKIMGLPVSLFALQMTSIIGSLLVIIFSFSIGLIVFMCSLNVKLYVVLIYLTKHPTAIHFKKKFPKTISTKKITQLFYNEN
ncbi:hypothetical protein [Imtechella halotolerans]|uniref:Membrane protein n=1 Tax=Imtechella halotolerans K1 TaxID=946077 RepID=I0WGI7_9FLAO|nr:hypothetical protein [Imtechella halotolerans]EID75503.1 membrane protein [Imtechella halotolerans K1]WMQ63668.1 hypothetical protein PT603_01535 [Imtechella halotolerans]